MLHDPEISEIAANVARAQIGSDDLIRIVTEDATDSEGNDALRITLVLTTEAARTLTGDEALDLLVDIQRELRDMGEQRFPIVEYATELELEGELKWGEEDAEVSEDDA